MREPPADSTLAPLLRPGRAALFFVPLLALLAAYAVFYAQFAVALIQFPFDMDQGEGYDAWSAWLINLGQLPYTHGAVFPYYSDGYPPVWSYLVSIPMAWLGPGVGPARLVSAIATGITCLLLARVAGRRSRSVLAGLLAAGFFLASPYVYHTTALARVNATALMVGVVAVTLAEKPTWRRTALVVAASIAALYTKPTAVDAAAAAVLAILLARRTLGIVAAMGTAVGGLACLAILERASGGSYLLNVLLSNGSAFDMTQLVGYLVNFVELHAFLLVAAAVEWVWSVRRRDWSSWTLYLPCAVLVLLATVGKTGGGESYFLATIAASSIFAAGGVVRLIRFCETRRVWWPAAVGGVVLLLQGLVMAHGPLTTLSPRLRDRGFQAETLGALPSPSEQAQEDAIAQEMQQAPGPVLSEDASFAVVAGKTLVGATPPSLRNLYHAGLWDPAPLVSDVEARRFSLVLLDAQMYPEPVLQAIGRSYYEVRVVQVGSARYHLMLPGSN